MSRVLTLSTGGYVGSKARSTKTANLSFGPISFKVLSVAFLTMLALLYLAQSQNSATMGYKIKDMEGKKAMTVERNEELSIEASKLRSIQSIGQDISQLKLVPSREYTYLR
jgi:hypothetical protein